MPFPLLNLLADAHLDDALHHIDVDHHDTAFVHHDESAHPTAFTTTHVMNSGIQDDTIEYQDQGPLPTGFAEHSAVPGFHPSMFVAKPGIDFNPDDYMDAYGRFPNHPDTGGYAHPPGHGEPYPHEIGLRFGDHHSAFPDHRQSQLATAFSIGAGTFCGFLGTFSYYVVQEAKKKINDQLAAEAELESGEKLEDIFGEAEKTKFEREISTAEVATFPPQKVTTKPTKSKRKKHFKRTIESGDEVSTTSSVEHLGATDCTTAEEREEDSGDEQSVLEVS